VNVNLRFTSGQVLALISLSNCRSVMSFAGANWGFNFQIKMDVDPTRSPLGAGPSVHPGKFWRCADSAYIFPPDVAV